MTSNYIKLFIIEDDNDINSLLEPYKNTEYLPINLIEKIIRTSFSSCEILHSYSSYHKIIKIKISDLLLFKKIKNWKYNRPPDLTRCQDIARYIYLSQKVVDNMLFLSFNNLNQSFDIIDGIHRYTSLKIIKNENSKDLDLLTPSDFGSNNNASWLYDSYIILNIRFNSNEGELIEIFKSLNKSHPIPELYIRDINKEKREIIETVANNWQIKYKTHFSSNNKPNKPNINRDRFIDLLEKIYDKHNISNENKYLLDNILENLNTNILYNIPKKLTNPIKEKCLSTGLWLFIYSPEELIQKLKL